MPDLLATPGGRLTAFFLLYLTEGIPIGYAGTAMATHMRRMGIGAAEIGAFVAALYLPWAFKWAAGPVVDVFRSQRWGPRRAWILAMQVLMVTTLAAAAQFDPASQIALVTGIILLHNSFAAVQDVAIDALAIGSLQPEERGRAAGLMFAGASVGQAMGGAGALAVAASWGQSAAIWMVCASILAVTVFVVLPLRERPQVPDAGVARGPAGGLGSESLAGGSGSVDFIGLPGRASRWHAVGDGLRTFLVTTWQTVRESRPARFGLLVALLPPGCLSLGLALKTSLGVDIGLDDAAMAGLALVTSVLGAAGCVIGGLLADRWGRRATLTVAVVGTMVPVVLLALLLSAWTPDAAVSAGKTGFLAACAVFALFNGMMYGSLMPMFMDITRTAVAATQFTAYTALMNLAITMSARWQGSAAQAWGYSWTLLADAALGGVILLFLPLIQVAWRRGPSMEKDRG